MATNNEAIIAGLTKAFSKVYTEETINNRAKVFAQIASFAHPKTGTVVGSILSADEIGEIINRISMSFITSKANKHIDVEF